MMSIRTFMQGLAARLHVHRWETTRVNPYMLPMRQVCRCGAERWKEVSYEPLVVGRLKLVRFEYRWRTSDGEVGPWLSMFTDEPVKSREDACAERTSVNEGA